MNDQEKVQQRVAIAKDVIEQVKAGNYWPSTTVYFIVSTTKALLEKISPKRDLRELLPEISKSNCRVCALGAALLSKANLYDRIPSSILNNTGFIQEDDIRNNLSDIFTPESLALIECAFQKNEIFSWVYSITQPTKKQYIGSLTKEQVDKVVNFGQRYYQDNDKRMIAIMENIVENQGEFIPE